VLICSAKAPTEILKIENFSVDNLESKDLDIGVYLQIRDSYSIILNFISRNFATLFDDPDIGFLKKDEFKLILKHKYLNVQQEDHVIRAIILWS